jgi:hypothetical protein
MRIRQGFQCNTCGKGLGPNDTRNKCADCKRPAVRAAKAQIRADWKANADEVVVSIEPAPKTFTVRG